MKFLLKIQTKSPLLTKYKYIVQVGLVNKQLPDQPSSTIEFKHIFRGAGGFIKPGVRTLHADGIHSSEAALSLV